MNGEDIMEQLFREYFADILSNDNADNGFNIKIGELSKEEFGVEFNIFVKIYSHFFYNENRLMYFINNYEIKLDEKIVEHILKLYNYSRKHEMKKHSYLLVDFILTYYNTVHRPEYIKNMGNNNAIKDLVAIFRTYSSDEVFIKEIKDVCFEFYNDIINYSIKNDIFVSARTVDKIINNLSGEKYKCLLFDLLLTSKTDIYNLCEHDYDLKEHRVIYECYIRDNIPNIYGFNNVNKTIKRLDCYDCISIDFSKEMINQCIKTTNILGNHIVCKDENCINLVSAIDDLKQLLLTINGCKNILKGYKEKIKECLYCILSLKRRLLYDTEYVDKEMMTHEFKFTIPKEYIRLFEIEIKNNHFNLYNLLKIDFDKCMENTIKNFSTSPLSSFVTRMRIDSDSKMYYLNEEKKINTDSSFKRYYDKIGNEYTINNAKDLRNQIRGNYYEEMLIYLQSYYFHSDIGIKTMLLKDEINGIVNTMKEFMKYSYDNEYAMIVNNIVAIESTINDVAEKVLKNAKKNVEDNLQELFDYYVNEYEKRNGLMYINYLLYEKSGPNYRNRYIHGNAPFDRDFNVPLLCTFAIIIFLGWLMNDEN